MNSIKLGDEVRFLNENLEGIVTSINGNVAGVTIEDDFEIPVPISQLVKASGFQKNETFQPGEIPATKEKITNSGIFVAFDRINEVLLDLKLFNGEAEEIIYAFYEEKDANIILKKSGKIVLNEIAELGKYDLEKFSIWPEFHFQILKLNPKPDKLSNPVNQGLAFHAKEFHGSFKYVSFLNRQAYLFKIEEEKLNQLDINKLRERDFSEKIEITSSFNKRPNSVIDLHIDKLVVNSSLLTPTEMISTQMDAFKKSLEMAHVHKLKNLVLIHGVGNHFLKNKIRNYLDLQKQMVSSYNDADSLKFGGGATEVFFN
jgi:hypothetical protein